MKSLAERYSDRTCAIIRKNGRILLRATDGWYLGQWSCVVGGEDSCRWANRKGAVEFGNLQVAFAIAKIFNRHKVKVVVVYPKKK